MDLSDLPQPYQGSGQRVEAADAQALVTQLGGEVASHLSQALERVAALAASGRIDREGLRALRNEIEAARRAGIMGQQVVRLASGRVRVASEPVDLAALLREALRQRAREIASRGIELRQQLVTTAAVASDSTLAFALLHTLLDWTFQHAAGPADLTLEAGRWPVRARIAVRYPHGPAQLGETPVAASLASAHDPALDTVAWRLLWQTAAVLGVRAERRDAGGRTELTIEFADPAGAAHGGAGIDADVAHGSDAGGINSQPLAGRHVMVLATRRDVRKAVREALRPMGLMLDFVESIEQAQALFGEGLPHAVVYEASLGGARFERLRAEWQAEAGDLAFIELTEEGRTLQTLAGPRPHISVGRDVLAEALPAALWFELARHAAGDEGRAARGQQQTGAAAQGAGGDAVHTVFGFAGFGLPPA